MNIEFSDHALEQIKARKISDKQVTEAVKNPDKKVKSFRNRVLRQKKFGDKILEVVTITEGPRITVVTGYYLEE